MSCSSLLLQTITSDTWKQLQDLYQAASKKNPLENVQQKINLLPIDIKEKLFNYCYELNHQLPEHDFDVTNVLYPLETLQKTITKIANETFQQLNSQQQHYVRFKFHLSSNFNGKIGPLQLLHALDQLNELLFACIDTDELIAELKKNSKLLEAIPLFISHLDIKEETARIEIAKICSQHDAITTAKFIKNFGIKEEAARIEIANSCVNQDSLGTAQFIQEFDIQEESIRIKIASSCAQKDKAGAARYIKNFGITDQKALLQIANLCAQKDVREIAFYIHNFGIEDQEALIQIANFCASKDAELIALNIQNFCIKDEAARIEIATTCAQKYVRTAQYIKNFGIKDQAALVQIAQSCAQNYVRTAQYIHNFGIQDETALIQIANSCAQKDGYTTAEHIRNFGIKDKTALIQIATSCAIQDALTAQHIQNFDIQDEAALIKIAIICARENGETTAGHIENFGIKNETALIDIAKLCAQESGLIAMDIHNFGIQDEASLIEIAKNSALQNAEVTAEYIENFGIENETGLIEIAKLCAQESGSTAMFIQYFHIEDPAALIQIAKDCAQQNGEATAEHIKNFGIQNKSALFEIAMLCAQQDGQGTLKFIHYFNILDASELKIILSLSVSTSPDCIMDLAHQMTPEAFCLKEDLCKLLNPLTYLKEEINNENPTLQEVKTFLLSNICSYIEKHLDQNSLFLKQAELLNEINDIYALQQASKWIASMLFFLALLDQDQQELIDRTELLKNLLSIRSPILRQSLSHLAIILAYKENGLKIYSDLLNPQPEIEKAKQKGSSSLKNKGTKKKKPSSKESKLLDLILASLQVSGIKKATTDQLKSAFYILFKGHSKIRCLLETLCLLDKSLILSSTEKEHVLQLLCAEDRSMRRQTLFALQSILLFKEEERLKTSGNIKKIATTVFQEKMHIDLANQGFERFQQLFMAQRNPHALITYAAKLFLLGKIEINNDLSRYVNSVLLGTFPQDRYQLDNNPHLKKLTEYNPDLLQKWKTPLDTLSMVFSGEEKLSFDPRSWLQDKIAHGHMKPNQLSHLADLLQGIRLEKSSLLPIEKAIENLLNAQDKLQQIAALEEIAGRMRILSPCQFEHDVHTQLELLKAPIFTLSDEVSIIDTDDYQDLLLCGTEVSDSCQNVNGQPNLNKGLLGYILDGKNRLIAVKDKQGRIMARAKLSILWDGQAPALYIEKVYTQGKYEKQCLKAITDMALAKAQSLGIPLTAGKHSDYFHDRPPIAFNKDLESLGGGASHEYVDVLRGVQENGLYKIHEAYIAALT